jgi:hypothetical protein
VAVFPVLVGGAPMPEAGNLPEAIARLAQFQALPLTHERWDHDMDDLVEALRPVRPVVTLPGVRSKPPLVVTAQARESERTVLHSLFGRMRNKRALLDSYQRADQAPVTDSIRDLRNLLIEAGDQLGPDSAAGPRLRLISDAIHDYLTAVEAADPDVLFAPALRDLRNAVRDVVRELGEAYDLEVARELVARMDALDAAVSPETRRLYADPHHREVTFEHG